MIRDERDRFKAALEEAKRLLLNDPPLVAEAHLVITRALYPLSTERPRMKCEVCGHEREAGYNCSPCISKENAALRTEADQNKRVIDDFTRALDAAHAIQTTLRAEKDAALRKNDVLLTALEDIRDHINQSLLEQFGGETVCPDAKVLNRALKYAHEALKQAGKG